MCSAWRSRGPSANGTALNSAPVHLLRAGPRLDVQPAAGSGDRWCGSSPLFADCPAFDSGAAMRRAATRKRGRIKLEDDPLRWIRPWRTYARLQGARLMSTTSERPSPCSEKRNDRTACIAWALRSCGALLLGGSAFAQSLVNGGVVSGAISAPGERDTYTFDAQQWDRFEIRLVDVNASSLTPQVELYNPNGVLIRTSSSPDVAVIDTTEVR